MRVITVSETTLQRDATRLGTKIIAAHPQIDMIIGIATGGAVVSRHIYDFLTGRGWSGTYKEIYLSRASTHTKRKSGLSSLLPLLPYSVLDLLRNIEALYCRFQKEPTPPQLCYTPLSLSQEITEAIRASRHILLVDDAVDTGATLLRTKHTIETINPHITVTTAVLTVTQDHPYIVPDHTLYRHTLLRCPWAMDYKGE